METEQGEGGGDSSKADRQSLARLVTTYGDRAGRGQRGAERDAEAEQARTRVEHSKASSNVARLDRARPALSRSRVMVTAAKLIGGAQRS